MELRPGPQGKRNRVRGQSSMLPGEYLPWISGAAVTRCARDRAVRAGMALTT
jgi:hypothetical protein